MSITKSEKKDVFESYGIHDKDTGSSYVQISLLTKRIVSITDHLKSHKHDHGSRRGLLKLVGRRKRLMKYTKRKDAEGYSELIAKLGIRG